VKMAKNLATSLAARPGADPILLLKAPKGTFHAPWDAARAVEALKMQLPSEKLHLDIVVMDGEPLANPKLFGPSAATAYIRSILANIAVPTWEWSPTKLDY